MSLMNPLFDLASFAYAAQSVLVPFSATGIVWNILLAPLLPRPPPQTLHSQPSAAATAQLQR